MKLPPGSSQLRSHSRTGHDSASGVIDSRQGIDPKFFDSGSGKRRYGKRPLDFFSGRGGSNKAAAAVPPSHLSEGLWCLGFSLRTYRCQGVSRLMSERRLANSLYAAGGALSPRKTAVSWPKLTNLDHVCVSEDLNRIPPVRVRVARANAARDHQLSFAF